MSRLHWQQQSTARIRRLVIQRFREQLIDKSKCGAALKKFERAETAEELTTRKESWPLSLPVAELIND